jgi:hypothetical protein
MNGVRVLSSFGIARDLSFKPISGGSSSAAITAQLARGHQEAGRVSRALKRGGFQITSLHNHMLTEQPRRFFLHIWAVGDSVALAGAVRSALNVTRTKPGHGAPGRG